MRAKHAGDLGDAHAVARAGRKSGPAVRPQGCAKHLRGQVGLGIAGDGDVIGQRSGMQFSQACARGQDRQSGPMFDAVQPFLFERGEHLPIRQQCRGGVSMECVESENDHGFGWNAGCGLQAATEPAGFTRFRFLAASVNTLIIVAAQFWVTASIENLGTRYSRSIWISIWRWFWSGMRSRRNSIQASSRRGKTSDL